MNKRDVLNRKKVKRRKQRLRLRDLFPCEFELTLKGQHWLERHGIDLDRRVMYDGSL
jgi:hypothetical protein